MSGGRALWSHDYAYSEYTLQMPGHKQPFSLMNKYSMVINTIVVFFNRYYVRICGPAHYLPAARYCEHACTEPVSDVVPFSERHLRMQ